ncbi:ricin-type beta-trefoil lectin domain protein [Catenulispora pinisilvae]|uniref:ricin-type beta-trefoil lectin domain protein n=1 Tax=Catenulispora pinisilvae TaxID=2705253 RepID=UPI0018921977|nr:ricin-type beta-trefoil lectin domain protein [Catenulispora pinisilvae]
MDASGGTGRPVRGRSLHDVLHDPGTGIAQAAVLPLDPSRVALIARAILTALAAGRVHGYINPHTILLTDDGNAVLVGDRVAIGATPANDVYALGTTLFEAVEGYAPHPAEPVPAATKAGVLAPLIEALTRRDPAERPDAGQALELLTEIVTAAAASDAAAAASGSGLGSSSGSGSGSASDSGSGSGSDDGSADAAETTTLLPQVPSSTDHEAGESRATEAGDGVAGSAAAGPGEGGAAAGSGASDDTSLLPPVPADPRESPGPPGPPGPPRQPGQPGPPAPPRYSIPAYPDVPNYATDTHSNSKRKALVIGGVVAAVVLTGGVALGVTKPWHRTDNSVSTVPGVPVASTSIPTTPAAAAPSTSATPATPSSTPTPTPTPTPSTAAPSALVSMTLCLDATSAAGGVHTGAKVTAEACHGGPNQAWQIHTDGTVHSMADPNLCLDAASPNGKVQNGAQVSAWTCHGGPNQDWAWNANGTVSPVANTGLCLDAAGPVPIHAGANVTAWPCNGGPNEKWAKQ